MEVSNRTIGIAFATVVVIAACVRSQTGSFAASESVATNSQVSHMNAIPDSTFSEIVPVGNPVTNTSKLGTPNSQLIRQNQSGVVPAPSASQAAGPQTMPSQASSSQTTGNFAPWPQNSYSQDDTSGLSNDNSGGQSGDLSDEAMLEIASSSLNESERATLRQTWFVMSPSEREDFLAQLR